MTFCIQWINAVSTFTEMKKYIEYLKIDQNKSLGCVDMIMNKNEQLPFSHKKIVQKL